MADFRYPIATGQKRGRRGREIDKNNKVLRSKRNIEDFRSFET
jgi:hypothetical protein